MRRRFFSRVGLILGVGALVAVMLASSITFSAAQSPPPGGPTEGPIDEPVCAPDWLIEVYVWGEPDHEEPWYYYWWYQWCYDPDHGWEKEWHSWAWWKPVEL